MKHYKSERLKKFEAELNDLEHWLNLGLVPKRDIPKHKEEITAVKAKIEEEKERLQFLRESGESDDYVAPKKSQTRTGFTEMPTVPDVDPAETSATSYQDSSYAGATEHGEDDGENDDEQTLTEGDEESYFSDRNRWKRGSHIMDPDRDEW